MKRREFIEFSAVAIAVLNAHSLFAASGCTQPTKQTSNSARIRTLRLLTIASFAEMKKFYGETIGLPVTEKNGGLIVNAGETTITFIKSEDKSTRPFYHFAFNIPENKIQKAFEWQKKRTPIVHPNPDGPRDQVVNFAHWNAHSIFFLDPAGNLLEYIARHDLACARPGEFTVNDIMYASEIGFIVDDVNHSGKILQKELNLSSYRDQTEGFWPIGDETGLLLMIRKGRIWSSRPGEVNSVGVFKTMVEIAGESISDFLLPGFPYSIKAVL